MQAPRHFADTLTLEDASVFGTSTITVSNIGRSEQTGYAIVEESRVIELATPV